MPRIQMVTTAIKTKSISVYPTTNGMTSPMIFLYRYTIIKRIIKRKACFFSIFLAILGGVATYYFSGRSLKPLKEFSEKIEEVEARNLSDSRIEEIK